MYQLQIQSLKDNQESRDWAESPLYQLRHLLGNADPIITEEIETPKSENSVK